MTVKRAVIVEPYNPLWVSKFEEESRHIARTMGAIVVKVHHIGSTSIPNIYAKPIIDMLVEVIAIEQVDSRNAAMVAFGYVAMGEYGLPGRRYFRKDNVQGIREYHVHTYALGSPEGFRHIAFRDFMRAHPELAQQYSDLKCQLAHQYPEDIQSYMDGKNAFIKDMERRALAWKQV